MSFYYWQYFGVPLNFLIQYFLNWTAWSAIIIYILIVYMSITIIYYSVIQYTSFCKNHSTSHSILSISPTCNFLFLQYLFIAKHIIIVIVPQNMYNLKPFYQFCDSCIHFKETNIKFFKCSYGFKGHYRKMRDVCVDFEPLYGFVSIHSKIIKLEQN